MAKKTPTSADAINQYFFELQKAFINNRASLGGININLFNANGSSILKTKYLSYTTRDSDVVKKLEELKQKYLKSGATANADDSITISAEDAVKYYGNNSVSTLYGYFFEVCVFDILVQKCLALHPNAEIVYPNDYYWKKAMGLTQLSRTIDPGQNYSQQSIVRAAAEQGVEALIELYGGDEAAFFDRFFPTMVGGVNNPKGDIQLKNVVKKKLGISLELKFYDDSKNWITYFNKNDTSLFGEGHNYLSYLYLNDIWYDNADGAFKRDYRWENHQVYQVNLFDEYLNSVGKDAGVQAFFELLLRKGDKKANLRSKQMMIAVHSKLTKVVVSISNPLLSLAKAKPSNKYIVKRNNDRSIQLRFIDEDKPMQSTEDGAFAVYSVQKQSIERWSLDSENLKSLIHKYRAIQKRPVNTKFEIAKEYFNT